MEPLSQRLVASVTESLARRLLESGPVREMAREAITSAAERLVRQRLEELESEASSDAGSGPDDRKD